MKNIHILPTDKPSRLHKIGNELGLTDKPNSNFLAKQQNIYLTNDEEIKEGDWSYRDSGIVFKMTKELLEHYESIKDTDTHKRYKIILTTDTDLITNGVQAIDDEFLEWFVKNPSCEEVEFENEKYILQHLFKPQEYRFRYKIIIPKEEPKFVTVNIESAKGEDLGKVTYIPLPNIDYIPKQETLEESLPKNRWKYTGKQETLEEAAKKEYQDNIVMDVDIDNDLQRAFINGAKSDVAKAYWYNIFKQNL